MANVLQVSSQGVNSTPGIHVQGGNLGPLGPGRVQGPQIPGQSQVQGPEQGQQVQGQIDFESNYAAFVTRMRDALDLPEQLDQLLFKDGAQLLMSGNGEMQQVLNELFSTIQMDDPSQLLQYFSTQQDVQAKFTGDFFNDLRGVLAGNISDNLKNAIQEFLKSYNDYSSGTHYLNQMQSSARDISSMLLKSYRGDFEDLLNQMDWNAEPGDTQANTELINNQIIPFLSKYVSRTHDYGSVRKASMLFVMYAAKYENGNKSVMEKLFSKIARNGDFQLLFKGEDAKASFAATEEALKTQNSATQASDLISNYLLKGAQGSAGPEQISQYYKVLNNLLLNESMYMPLLHMLIPFRYQNKDVMSEMWVDPDADKKKSDGDAKTVKLLLKFNIEGLGNFDMITQMKERNVDMHLFVPETVKETPKNIQTKVGQILSNNGLSLRNIELGKKTRDIRVEEVFPEIREKESGINVAV